MATRPSTWRVYQFRHQRVWRPQCSRGSSNRIELALERVALRLEPRRQREALAERLLRLVDEEAGRVGRDLDQHAVGHAEVDRAEVLAVLDGRRAQAELGEVLEPGGLLGVIRRAPRDVVRRASADQRSLLDRLREV